MCLAGAIEPVFRRSTKASGRRELSVESESGERHRSEGHSTHQQGSTELIPGTPLRLDNRYLALDIQEETWDKNDEFDFGDDSVSVLLDFAKISGPLRVRHWRAGDRFVPFGMTGSKKIKSYLTDAKVKSSRRKKPRVVCDDEKIVWLVGYRLDNRVRLDEGSKIVARLSVSL